MAKFILILTIFISLLIRILFVSQSKHIADVYLMLTMGATFLKGGNPYLVLDFNSYPPLAIFLEVASMRISELLHTSFAFILKFWPNLADFISALIIFQFLIKTKVKFVEAYFWTAFFLLNPISIIISAAHGQLDSIPSLLLLLSIFYLTFYSKRNLSALLLGLAIAIKPNPAMLTPLFLFYKKTRAKQKIIYLILVLTPLIVGLIPFVWQNPQQVLTRIITYSGIGDFSYAAILRGIWYQNNAITNLPLTAELLLASKLMFVTAAFSLTLLFAGSKQLVKATLVIYLLFISLYFGIAAQYLIWILPLAILERDKMVFYYTFFGSIALLGFYLFFGPDILLGKLSSMPPFQTKYIYLYFLGNLVFWIFNMVWLIRIVTDYVKKSFFKFSLVRRRLIYFTAVLFILTLFPMIFLILQLFKLYSLES